MGMTFGKSYISKRTSANTYRGGGASVEKWELAYKDRQQGMKYKEIAEKYGVSINTVKAWKSRKWNKQDQASNPLPKKVAHKKEKGCTQKKLQPVIDNDELTEQQKMFCLFYLQHFNATKAYQQAYQCDYKVANSNAYLLMVKDGIKEELRRLKNELQRDIFIDVKDLIFEYIKQFSADITDFVEFDSTEHKVYQLDENGEKQEVYNDFTGELETYKISSLSLKKSSDVDGTLIQEVKKGKDGVSVKLYDKQKAMTELMKYLGGDALREAQIVKAKRGEEVELTEETDDGFLAALEAEGENLWSEE